MRSPRLASEDASAASSVLTFQTKAAAQQVPAEVAKYLNNDLPFHCNYVTCVDKVLRDTSLPFANAPIWRSLLKSVLYTQLVKVSFWWVVLHEVRKVARPPSELLYVNIAHCYAKLFDKVPSDRKDAFFGNFYEAWSVTLLLILQNGFPRRKALFDEKSFREHLLDLCAGWTIGRRPYTVKKSHWIQYFDSPSREANGDSEEHGGTFITEKNGNLPGSSPARPASRSRRRRPSTAGNLPTAAILSGKNLATTFCAPPPGTVYEPSRRTPYEFGYSPLIKQHLEAYNIKMSPSLPVRLLVTRRQPVSWTAPPVPAPETAANSQSASGSARTPQSISAAHLYIPRDCEGGPPPNVRPLTADQFLQASEVRRQHAMRTFKQNCHKTTLGLAKLRVESAVERRKLRATQKSILLRADLHEISYSLAENLKSHRGAGSSRNCAALASLIAKAANSRPSI